jgi:hypothetical protein
MSMKVIQVKKIAAARNAVKVYAAKVWPLLKHDFPHVPTHYHIADLVEGLMHLSEQERLNWDKIVADAKEGL